jgi:16S rRNA (cytosine967-C5)-methyltransferase
VNLHFLFSHTIELYKTVLAVKKPADYQVATYFKERRYLGSNDRKFINETFYNVLRQKIYFDAMAEQVIRETNFPERLKDHAVVFMFSLSKQSFSEFELTETFVALTKLSEPNFKALTTFYAAHQDLDFISSESERFSTRHAFPLWLTDVLSKDFSRDELGKLYDALNSSASLVVRANSYKIQPDALRAVLDKENIETTDGKISPFAVIASKRHNLFNLKSFKDGLFEVQDEGSQLISILLNAKPNAKVLDACAGAGGKTLHIAAMMKGKGDIFAFDTDSFRLANIHKRIQRSGLQNIRVLDTPEKFDYFKQRNFGKVDYLLIDAPCSGIGTLRRSPDIKLRTSPDLVREMNTKQTEILNTFADYLKPAGRLLYATCSILKSENDDIIDAFLATHPDFVLKPISDVLNEMKVDFDITKLKAAFGNEKVLRLYPYQFETDGFFAAVLEKKK